MIRLFLLRHGNTFEAEQTPIQIGARSDLPLTAHGCAQAELFAQYLASQKIRPEAIYAGALQRQSKTAQILQGHLGSPLLQDAALTEIDYGSWEGLTSQEIADKWPEAYTHWTERGVWAEGIFGRTLQEHLEEIERLLGNLRTNYETKSTVVAVTSNGVMRFFGGEGKVKTGHFCELHLVGDAIKVIQWNVNPRDVWKKDDLM